VKNLQVEKQKPVPEKRKPVQEKRQDRMRKKESILDEFQKLVVAARAKAEDDLRTAEDYYKQALEKLREDPDPDNTTFRMAAIANHSLATIYRRKGENQKAADIMERAVELMQTLQDDELTDKVIDAQISLAELHILLENFDRAEQFLQMAMMEAQKKSESANNSSESSAQTGQQAAIIIDTLANLKYAQQKFKEAEVLAVQAADLLIKTHGSRDLRLFESLLRSSRLFIDQGKDPTEFFTSFLQKQKKILGGSNKETGNLALIIAHVQYRNKKLPQTEELLLFAISILDKFKKKTVRRGGS